MEISGSFDIASYSVAYASMNVLSQVSVAMLDKTLDLQQITGDNLARMMEMSVNPSVGGNIDIHI